MSLGKQLGFCLIGAALLAGLSGCATTPPVMHTQVTTFNQWTQVPADKSYVFGRTLEFQNSLELTRYEDIVRDELTLKGFKEAANPAQAKLTVTLRPSISSRDVRVRDPWPADPFWSPYGWYGSRFGHRPFGWYDPYWSFPQDTDYSVTVYRHRLELDHDRTKHGATASTAGGSATAICNREEGLRLPCTSERPTGCCLRLPRTTISVNQKLCRTVGSSNRSLRRHVADAVAEALA